MIDAIHILCWALATIITAPVLVFCSQCALAMLHRGSRRTPVAPAAPRLSVAVLIPAHDEEIGLPATLASVRAQVCTGDRVIVVADNCTDRTAEVARAAGAEVVERHDPDRRGKGFALAAGVQALRADPPPIVVVIDADCELGAGALDALAIQVAQTRRTAQAVYLLNRSERGGAFGAVSAFAFLVKNLVRPLGMDRLGLPVLLTGSGMAFPWEEIARAQLATADIVEDCQLGLDLIHAGRGARLCVAARVRGTLPSDRRAATGQRRRWEHGLLSAMLRRAPRLLLRGVRLASLAPLAAAMDLCVPPLALLTMGLVAGLGLTAAAAPITQDLGPALVLAATLVLLTLTLGATWARFARRSIPATALLAAPWYMLRKLPIYVGFIARPQRAWVRTQREAPAR